MRRAYHWILSLLVVAGAALALAPAAGACVLAKVPTDTRVQQADVVFTGTVLDVTPLELGGTSFTVEVDRRVKGSVPGLVELRSGVTSCQLVPTVGQRIALGLRPATPPPWNAMWSDVLPPADVDALPYDRLYRAARVTKLAASPARRAVQVHFRGRACTSVRATLVQGASTLTATLRSADGPQCTSGRLVDRCVTLLARRALGRRALRPAAAARVAPVAATRCPGLPS